jgi:TonB family protein
MSSSRASGMLSEMRQRRAERKKPKRFVVLKKVSLDTSEQHSISTVQANIAKHPITQKHVGRSSTAFSVAVVFHVIIGFIISAFFIVEQIDMDQEIFNISIITEESKTKRLFRRRETPKFETKEQAKQELLIKRPVKTDTSQPLSNDPFSIPDGSDTAVDLTSPSADAGPKMIDVERNFAQPSRSIERETKAPTVEVPREAPSLINKLETDIIKEAPGLGSVDFDPEPGVINPQYKFRVEPKYPDAAKKAEKEGEVVLQATIDENGIPQDIIALTDIGFGLEEAAIEALKKTTFRPATKGGEPISKQVAIPYKFTLKDN